MTTIEFKVKLRLKNGFTDYDIPEIREHVVDAIKTRPVTSDVMGDLAAVTVHRYKQPKVREETVMLESVLQMHDHGHYPIKEHHAKIIRKLLKK